MSARAQCGARRAVRYGAMVVVYVLSPDAFVAVCVEGSMPDDWARFITPMRPMTNMTTTVANTGGKPRNESCCSCRVRLDNAGLVCCNSMRLRKKYCNSCTSYKSHSPHGARSGGARVGLGAIVGDGCCRVVMCIMQRRKSLEGAVAGVHVSFE